MQTLNSKSNYTVNYLNLKLYVELGLIVKKVHRVLQFRQSLWLRPYILLNTENRQRSVNKFQEGFFKLMNNSCYGKTLESKRNRIHVQLIRSNDEAQRVTDKSLMQSFKIFDENLAAVTLKQTKIFTGTKQPLSEHVFSNLQNFTCSHSTTKLWKMHLIVN